MFQYWWNSRPVLRYPTIGASGTRTSTRRCTAPTCPPRRAAHQRPKFLARTIQGSELVAVLPAAWMQLLFQYPSTMLPVCALRNRISNNRAHTARAVMEAGSTKRRCAGRKAGRRDEFPVLSTLRSQRVATRLPTVLASALSARTLHNLCLTSSVHDRMAISLTGRHAQQKFPTSISR